MANSNSTYMYAGHRVTRLQWEQIEHEVQKMYNAAEKLAELKQDPVKNWREISILNTRIENAKFWVNKILNINKPKDSQPAE